MPLLLVIFQHPLANISTIAMIALPIGLQQWYMVGEALSFSTPTLSRRGEGSSDQPCARDAYV